LSGLLTSLTFATPWALAALGLLPVIWWLLRFTPPRPQAIAFAPIRLLLSLINREEKPDRTPWWLMALRLAIAALVIVGVSNPSYAPVHVAAVGSEPLLLVVDDTWAAAKDWDKRKAIMGEIVDGARKAGATVTIATSAPALRPSELAAGDATQAQSHLAALEPKALGPDRVGLIARLDHAFKNGTRLRVVWLADGIDDGEARDFARGLTKLAGGKAEVEAIVPAASGLPMALAQPALDGSHIKVKALRAAGAEQEAKVTALASNGRNLGEANLKFSNGSTKTEGLIDLPIELRNDVERLAIAGELNAGAVYLMDDRWRRKSVALQSGEAIENAQPLFSPLYYVSRAIEPYAELSAPQNTAELRQALDQGLSVLVLADIGVLSDESQEMIGDWVKRGGVLLRFAGPRLAGAQDALVPVTLREGGRSLGSAMSWETPQSLQAFPPKSPFAGLEPDPEVKIVRQVLAEPDASLPDKVWASLEDGTPLVTASHEGKGLIVLFHVTANADWSNLPLTGLFVEMLRRVIDLAPAAGSGGPGTPSPFASQDNAFQPWLELSGIGDLVEPPPETNPIAGAVFDKAKASPQTPAGIYRRGSQERAINLAITGEALTPISGLPSGIALRDLSPLPSKPLAPFAFAAAFLLFLLDCLAALLIGGGLHRLRFGRGAAAVVALLLIMPWPGPARADEASDFAMKSVLDTHLAYVITGDADIDRESEQGLKGLDVILRDRTSIEPADPVAIDIEKDEIVFFPLLYWPVKAGAPIPSDAALEKIDTYMKNGGTIFFDLRDDGAGSDALAGGTSATAQTLRKMLAKLDIPPLEPVPPEHVLTKSFYLMQNFPGRYDQGPLWVERSDNQGLTNGNTDGVSSIIIGSNDYAGAWALDDNSEPLYAVVPGTDRQRELAFRAGINIVMYALTGNYKADQVHVPALLERLGQ
jgi:hypothetical protein